MKPNQDVRIFALRYGLGETDGAAVRSPKMSGSFASL